MQVIRLPPGNMSRSIQIIQIIQIRNISALKDLDHEVEQIIQIICSRCAFFFTKRADRERMHPSRHPPNMLPGVELETAVFLTPRLAALSTKIVYYGKNRGYNAPKKQPVSYLFSLHPEPRVRSALAEAQNTSPSTYQVSRYDVHTKHTQRRKRQKKNIRHTHAKNAQQGE